MKARELFESVYSGELLNELDIYNEVELITDKFEQKKLQLLCDDFDRFLISKRYEKYGSQLENILKKLNGEISEKEYNKRISELTKPIFFIDDYLNNPDELDRKREEFMRHTYKFDIINDDVDLGSSNLDGLKNMLIDIMRNRFTIAGQVNNIQPIHWLKGEESLREFLQSIKKAGLIESRENDEIIQEHFYVDGQEPTKEPQPIIWKSKKVLLAHLIGGLDSSVKADHLWKTLAPHFHWKGKVPTGLRQSYHNNPYPNNIDMIKDILKKIKESK